MTFARDRRSFVWSMKMESSRLIGSVVHAGELGNARGIPKRHQFSLLATGFNDHWHPNPVPMRVDSSSLAIMK